MSPEALSAEDCHFLTRAAQYLERQRFLLRVAHMIGQPATAIGAHSLGSAPVIPHQPSERMVDSRKGIIIGGGEIDPDRVERGLHLVR